MNTRKKKSIIGFCGGHESWHSRTGTVLVLAAAAVVVILV
jgi:hypothetical protein